MHREYSWMTRDETLAYYGNNASVTGLMLAGAKYKYVTLHGYIWCLYCVLIKIT